MNPGPVEEAGQTARGLVDALKEQPVVLALVVFQVIFLFLTYYGVQESRTTFFNTVNRMVDQQQDMAKLLYNCVPHEPGK